MRSWQELTWVCHVEVESSGLHNVFTAIKSVAKSKQSPGLHRGQCDPRVGMMCFSFLTCTTEKLMVLTSQYGHEN